jgi:hypothetical protein
MIFGTGFPERSCSRKKKTRVMTPDRPLGPVVLLCPGCGKEMRHVRTIGREPLRDLYVLECVPCGVTLTQALEDSEWTAQS